MLVKQDSVERRAFSLKELAGKCGRSYYSLYRAALRGDLKVLSGFGRIMVSAEEFNRFLNRSEVYRPTKRRTRKTAAKADQGKGIPQNEAWNRDAVKERAVALAA